MTSWLDLGVFVAAWAWLWTSDRKKSLSRAYSLLSIFTLSYVFVYAFFIGEDKIRMMFPFYLPFVLVAGKFLSDLSKTRASAVWLLTAAIVAWHGYDVAAYLRRPKAHYRELAEYLESHHLTRGFADYWVAYPVIFHSHENVLISPTLIYPSFSERRPEYTRIVRASEDPVVILDRRINAGEIKPLEDRLQALGVRYRKTAFDEFLIYSDLTPKAFPERIALLGYRDP